MLANQMIESLNYSDDNMTHLLIRIAHNNQLKEMSIVNNLLTIGESSPKSESRSVRLSSIVE